MSTKLCIRMKRSSAARVLTIYYTKKKSTPAKGEDFFNSIVLHTRRLCGEFALFITNHYNIIHIYLCVFFFKSISIF